jgi:hypothetical protein
MWKAGDVRVQSNGRTATCISRGDRVECERPVSSMRTSSWSTAHHGWGWWYRSRASCLQNGLGERQRNDRCGTHSPRSVPIEIQPSIEMVVGSTTFPMTSTYWSVIPMSSCTKGKKSWTSGAETDSRPTYPQNTDNYLSTIWCFHRCPRCIVELDSNL